MKKLITVLAMLVVLATAGVATADILWDQTQGYETWQMGFFNVIGPPGPWGMIVYTANDVVVPAGGWNMDSVTVVFDGFDPNWANTVTMAVLHVAPKDSGTPSYDPTTGTSVPVTATVLGNGFMEVTASGLGQFLAAGEYWIGLTPNAPDANNIMVSVPAVGADSPSYDVNGFPPGWAFWSPGLDGAMRVEGDFGAVAVEENTFGSLKAIYR